METTPPRPPDARQGPGAARHVRVPWWLRLVLSAVVIGLLVWRVIIPELHDSRDAFTSLEQLSLPLVVVAVLLELASLAVFSLLTAAVLGRPRPGYATLLRIDLAILAVNHVLPGGGATSAALRFRLLSSHRVPAARALSAAAIQSVGTNLVLGLVFLTGLGLSLTTFTHNRYYAMAGGTVMGMLLLTVATVWILVRHTEGSVRVARRAARHVPYVTERSAEAVVRTVTAQAGELLSDRRHLGVVVTLAAGNWLLDAAALWVVLQAFGSTVHPGVLLTVYGVGNLLALLPITPGGLGIVEGVMVSSLIAFGTPAPLALLGVLGWHLMEFWLPLPLGAVAYLSLRVEDLWRHADSLESGRPALPPPLPADQGRSQRPAAPVASAVEGALMNPVTTTTHRRVVAVGVDGSPEATSAARYAADFAARNAWDLWLVSSYEVPPVPASAVVAFIHSGRTTAAAALQTTLDQVRVAPHVRLRTLVQQGLVNAVLTSVTAEVQLLVLGQHHLAPIDRAREGNHAAAVLAKASCPVTVVPAGWDPHRTALRPVVVALAGVADAHAALALAFDDASARRTSVVVVHVANRPSDEVTDSEIIADLAEIVAGAKQDFPDVPVRITLVDGPVGPAIVAQSGTASMVVLGRPHHHRLGSWHWSVARGVLDEVACPVTVVADEPVGSWKDDASPARALIERAAHA